MSDANIAVMFCWIPIVSIAGIVFPAIFLGRDAVSALKAVESRRRWLRYVRWSAAMYLLILFVALPLVVLATMHH